jgi:regulator of sigma E protease
VYLLQTILSFLVALVILVAVHEFGHFYVARRCGVKVLRFSVGFGKILWSTRDKTGTEYSFSALPLGGYVKMLDEREGEVPESERHRAFNNQSVWKRIAIVAAGPLANFLLAILLLWGLLLGGERSIIPKVGKVLPESVAAQMGIEPGQEILAVDGIPTPTWGDLNRALAMRLGETGSIAVSVAYADSSYEYRLQGKLQDWQKDNADPDPVQGFGIELYFPIAPIAGEITENSPAEKAGFKTGDRILKAGDQPIADFSEWAKVIQSHPEQPLDVLVDRAGQQLQLQVIPRLDNSTGKPLGKVGMGYLPQPIEESLLRRQDHSVITAFVRAVDKTWETSGFILLSIKKLIVGEISTKNLSGPVTIAKVAGSSARSGLESFIYFLVMISISLAIFNLLPVPVLDGGHLFYYLFEVIRGKPVSERIQSWGNQIGFTLIICLSLFALYNDFTRL